jgi:RNA polymerase sigma-70 factor (ECF subfamily)
MSDDETLTGLLKATAGGDEAAFDRLYGATSAKLFGVIARIIRQRDVAEEILQETYLRIWDHAGDYRFDKGRPMTWMITIARNRALDCLRRQRPERPLDDSPGRDAWPDPDPGPLDLAIAGESAQALRRCLDELGEEQRSCITLAYVEGYTHDELARRLACPLGTVKSWIRRGLAHLKSCLEP